MTPSDNIWPPPPTIPPAQQEHPRGYTWAEAAIRVVFCYTVLWTFLFSAALCLLDPRLFFYIIFGWQLFAILMFVQSCLHLPGVMLFQRLQRHASKNVMGFISAVWGGILASGHWVIYNYVWGGYDSTCDPDTGFFWVCGIPRLIIVAFLVAGSVTGYVVGRVLENRRLAHHNAHLDP